ncbi:MAG TPA: glycosyltransferase family 4 protein [Ramlibacter sp.]|nr:glycosyltransferase family 4 protein [Ramlibacter sp.]HSV55387.1 glycosyltransferase family 4 protein [Burkholderiaceae bacterium]
MARRVFAGGRFGGEGLSYEANDWLMRTMARECQRPAVTAVHAYEDCALWQFQQAKRLGKACIYDMPIGYYPAWEATQRELALRFADWLGPGGLRSSQFVRPQQKQREMELADVVLVPGSFVEKTVKQFHPAKATARLPYGVDSHFWRPADEPETGRPSGNRDSQPLRFIFVGQLSIRKGTPLLLEAWKAAALANAELHLVGMWSLAEEKRGALPPGVSLHGPLPAMELRARYQACDIFVFPSFFEGFGLVLLEAMACGLPAIATQATMGPDFIDAQNGRLIPTGDVDALATTFEWFNTHRAALPEMSRAARQTAEASTWLQYRSALSTVCADFC